MSSDVAPLPSFRRRSREVAVSAKDRAALFGKMQKAHTEKQLDNPFSEHDKNGAKLPMKKLDKNDPTYGKPLQGSITEKRGNEANSQIHKVFSSFIVSKINFEKSSWILVCVFFSGEKKYEEKVGKISKAFFRGILFDHGQLYLFQSNLLFR